MFHANISNNTTDYESPGELKSYRQVCEFWRSGRTDIRCPPAAGDARGR